MKLVAAIIKPFKLDDVRDALAEVGVQRFSYTALSRHSSSRSSATVP